MKILEEFGVEITDFGALSMICRNCETFTLHTEQRVNLSDLIEWASEHRKKCPNSSFSGGM